MVQAATVRSDKQLGPEVAFVPGKFPSRLREHALEQSHDYGRDGAAGAYR